MSNDDTDQNQAPAPPPEIVYLSFCAEISPSTAEGFLNACCEVVNSKAKSLYVLFSTPGGNIAQGIHIYNTLRALPLKIIMHNVGAVNSVGVPIFMAGEQRYANPGATFMFHGTTMPVETPAAGEQAMRDILDEVQSSHKQMAAILSERACFSPEKEILDLFRVRTTYDAELAKQSGIIHDVREAKLLPGHAVHQLAFNR